MRLLVAVSTLALLASPAMANDYPPPPTANATGGNGGSATSHSQATAKAHASSKSQSGSTSTGGQSSAQSNGNNVSIAGSIGGGSTGGGGRAPDLTLIPSTASGLDCPTVGVGIGGTGHPGAGLLSYSTLSTLCNQRMVARLASDLYGVAVAQAYAEQNIDGIKEAVAAVRKASVQVAPAPDRGRSQTPAICTGASTWTAAEYQRHPECH